MENLLTPAPPDSRLMWTVWVLGSLKQGPAAGELIRYTYQTFNHAFSSKVSFEMIHD